MYNIQALNMSESLLQEEVLKQANRLSFFQSVRILRDARNGLSLRFRATPSLGFPAHEISGLYREGPTDNPTHLTVEVPFLGLYGPSSPLPTFYTERLLRDESSSHNLRDFFDIFNHAFVSKLVDIRQFTRSFVEGGLIRRNGDLQNAEIPRILLRLGGLVALSENPSPQRDPDSAFLLRIIGLMAFRRGTAREVKYLISYIFKGASVEIEEWIPRPIQIDQAQIAHLGASATRLGGFLLGRRSIDPSAGIRLILTGLSYEDSLELLPGKAQYFRLARLLALIVPGGLHIQLVVRSNGGRPMTLGCSTSRLGWTTRLGENTLNSRVPQEFCVELSQ